jgi:hypothetical protein
MALAPTPPPGGGVQLKSPVGGPSGPGGSPMVSPGTGAGNQAMAKKKIGEMMKTLLELGAVFEAGSAEFNGVARAIAALNSVAKGVTTPPAPKAPIAVPGTPPGGPPAPPGMPSPSGSPMGGGPAMAPGGAEM